MDGTRFDDFARAVADPLSRRKLLRGLVGAVAGGLLAGRGAQSVAAAGGCKPAAPASQSKCNKDAQCCAGLVCQGRCTAGCRIDGTFYAAGATNPANSCQSCQPGTSTTAWTNKANDAPCDDGDPCTVNDTCQAGSCVAGSPKDCSSLNTDCQTGQCAAGDCQAVPTNVGGACDGNPNECLNGVCQSDGTCANTTDPFGWRENGTPCDDFPEGRCCNGGCISRFEACPV